MDVQVSQPEIAAILKEARWASYAMGSLEAAGKDEALERFAQRVEENEGALLDANRRDQAEQKGRITESLFQRLILDASKLRQIVQGIRDVARLPDPVGRVQARTLLDEGLVLEKVTVPLGVIGIIFESRPDVIPQILSLILKSGNAVVLKGGSEALHSNHAFMKVVEQLAADCPWLPSGWARLLDTRQAVRDMLGFPEYVDLVIPRGSSRLVKTIMECTQIPVLGHTEGVCHLYVAKAADLDQAVKLALDSKVQYPAACNALETLLVDESVAEDFLSRFHAAALGEQVVLKGCARTREILPSVREASEEDWRTEYGDRTLSVRVVDGLEAAIDHINSFGSHHTDAIATEDREAADRFLARVDSASVFWNASTRFADGFRYGLGAEIGISTNRTHARGPVGLEGLVSYKYKLRGCGQIVSSYVGPNARPFRHRPLD